MDPLALPQAVEKYGGWGAAGFLALVCIYLFREWQKCSDARIRDASAFATTLEKAGITMAAVAAALDSRTGIFERLGNLSEDGKQQAEVNARLILSKVDDLLRAVEELRREARR